MLEVSAGRAARVSLRFVDRPYPAHWEADVVLRDGRPAHLRPMRPDDADRLVAFYGRLSPETIYYRFFAPYPKLSDRDVERFTNVDHVDRVALIAVVGEDLIAVARYDRLSPEEAEVAFNIEDAHQGRGLGSVLLEHLAAAARERGIQRFVAEVLPSNRRMISVFQEAGYAVSREFEDDVVRLHFDITPTETSTEVMQAREHRSEARSVERLLRPESVAVIGAGRRGTSIGAAALRHLIAGNFAGRVHVVHPVAEEIAGLRTVPSVVDVPGVVDLAVLAVPADSVQQVVLECARKGVRGLVVMSSGYAETGPEGAERQRQLVRTARANGMRVVGPASFGLINTAPEVRLNASLAPALPPRGRVSFFSQSGALGVAILDIAAQRGLGLSTFVSAGNRADVSGNDLLQFWEEDPETDVVLLYLESIGNPRKFSRLSRRIGRSKPVVAVKSGRSMQGVPLGHTVRESRVPPAAVDALFAQSGVVRVDNIHELFDVAQLLATQPLPEGRRVAIVGNSAALAVLAADACRAAGLEVVSGGPALHPEAPVDEFTGALDAALARADVDSVVAAFMPPLGSLDRDPSVAATPDVLDIVAGRCAGSGKTVVATVLRLPGVGGAPSPAARVPSYQVPEDAVRALRAVTTYAEWRRRPVGEPPQPAGIDAAAARGFVERILREHPEGTGLSPGRLTELLSYYGIRLWLTVEVADADAAVAAAQDIGYPVVLKTTLAHLRHRPDLGDVRLDIASADELRLVYGALAGRLGPAAAKHVILQPMAPPGVPVVVGGIEDPLFGPVVWFGLGGLATELLGDRAYAIPPLTDVEAAGLVRSVRAAPLLLGYRGASALDVRAVEDLVMRVARLADDLPEVANLELNPVLVAPDGISVLNATCRLAPPLLRTDQGPRHLTD